MPNRLRWQLVIRFDILVVNRHDVNALIDQRLVVLPCGLVVVDRRLVGVLPGILLIVGQLVLVKRLTGLQCPGLGSRDLMDLNRVIRI